MEDDMIERVARALFCRNEGWPAAQAYSDTVNHWFSSDGPDEKEVADDLRDQARAAIEAMREPSAAMRAHFGPSWDVDEVWPAMIDAALSAQHDAKPAK